MGAKKNFVLDTNVILHDYKCIENFQENDIYLPIVVLEELDKFKKGSEQINYNAREFVRELDLLTSNDLFLKGASLGPGKGTLYIVTGDKYQEKIAHSFPDKTPDHRILSCALTIAEKNPKIKTTLVSKDVNLRMKARSLGIPVEDYITDKVVNVDIFERAQETYENIDPDLIDKIYSSPEGVDADSLDIKSKLDPNECFILKSVRNSVLARYNPFTDKIKKVDKGTNFGIQPRNAEQSFAFEVLNVIKTQFAPGNPDVRKIDDMQKNNQLVIEALAFIRGRSLSETYCIIDEAQNLTPHEIKTIITRAGEGTKMVFTGDIQQIDSPYLDAQSNGLAYMIDKMKGQDLFAHINLIKGERSELSELASDLL